MAMSQKVYQQTADILAGELALADSEDKRLVIRNLMFSLADMFKQDNDRFDRDRFYQAVGME